MDLQQLKIDLAVQRNLLANKTDEFESAIEKRDVDAAKAIKEELETIQDRIDELARQVEELEQADTNEEEEAEEENSIEDNSEETETKENNEEDEQRSTQIEGEDEQMENRQILDGQVSVEVRAFETYLETRDIEDGVKIEDGAAVIPKEIVTEILELAEDEFQLADLVTKRKVKTGSGTLPVRTTEKATLKTKAELTKSPEIAVTPFTEVDYKVETKRGYIPLSQELIDDGVNVVGDIKQYISEVVTNTENSDIMDVLKTLTNKQVKSVDELKDIVNVEMPVGSNVQFLLSQTVYNEIDKLKDETGKYLFQDNIASPSGKQLFGRQVIVVNDSEMPNKDTAFIGDFREVVLFDRSTVTAEWTNYLHYGQCLGVAVRNDVKLVEGAKIKKITFKPEAGSKE